MIAVAATPAAPIVLPFTPPIGLSIPYRTVATRPDGAGGSLRLSLDERLRFDAGPDGLRVSATVDGSDVEASPALRPLYQVLFAGTDGTGTRANVDAHGQVTAILDGAASWAVVRAAQAAALARLEADPARSADEKTRARRLYARMVDVDATTRDARLADALADLLPPPVPALRPGEAQDFTATLPGPAGPMKAAGTVALAEADAGTIRYRIETRVDRAAAQRAAAALVATLEQGASPEARARIEADAAALRDIDYRETLEAVVERATGLLVSSHLTRRATDDQGRETVVDDLRVTRLINTVF